MSEQERRCRWYYCDYGAEDAVAAMAGKEQVTAIAGENTERWIVECVVAIYALEIDDAGVERE